MDINSSRHSQDCAFPVITIMLSSISVLHILMVLLLVFVLFVAFQRWRKQPVSSPFTASSNHIDIFMYNMAILQLLGISGFCFLFFDSVSTSTSKLEVTAVGGSMFGIFSIGDILFHLLTCIERYLAVVHPLYYLRFKGSAGAKIRNIAIGCVWLISICVVPIASLQYISFSTINLALLSFTFVVICFCSFSLLSALTRPGPVESCSNNRLCNQSKKRALRPVVAITGTLLLRFIYCLIATIVQALSTPGRYIYCVAGWSTLFFLVPCSLVLPLLFLQRVGKLKICGQPDAPA